MSAPLEKALNSMVSGVPVLIYDADGREGETDLVAPSGAVTASTVRMMRKEAGGLICVTLPQVVARRLGLPRMEEILTNLGSRYPVLPRLVNGPLPYDSRSAFSISVNHRRTYTGVTDKDRALTVSTLAEVCQEGLTGSGNVRDLFTSEFRSPGHIPLLIAEEPLLNGRRGHTELATALTTMASITPSATLCEMMGDEDGPLPKSEAKKYARERNLSFLEGQEIIEAWGKWSGSWQRASLTFST